MSEHDKWILDLNIPLTNSKMEQKYGGVLAIVILALMAFSCNTNENEMAPDSQKTVKDRLLVKIGSTFYGIDTTTRGVSWQQSGLDFDILDRKLVVNTGFWAKEVATFEDTASLRSESFLTLVDVSSGQKTTMANPLTVDYRLRMAFGDTSQNPEGRFSTVAGIHQGVVYVRRRTSRNSESLRTWLVAVDIPTGKILWETDIPHEAPRTVSFSGEQIFLGFMNSSVDLELKTGKKIREFSLGYASYVGGDHVYMKNNDGVLVAFDRKTGDRRWEFASQDKDRYSNQCVLKGDVLLAAGNETLDAVDVRTGTLLWSKAGLNRAVNLPIQWMNDRVFIATKSNRIMALEIATGAVRWESQPIVYLDYKTGGVSTSNDARRPNFLVKNGRIIVQANAELLQQMSPETGELLPSAPRGALMGLMGKISDFYLLEDSSVDI